MATVALFGGTSCEEMSSADNREVARIATSYANPKTDVPTVTTESPPVRVNVAGLPVGGPLQVEYVSQNRVVLPDGEIVDLQPHPVRGIGIVGPFGRFGDRWGTVHNLPTGSMSAWYGLDGRLERTTRTALRAVSPDQRRALLVGFRGTALIDLDGTRAVWRRHLRAASHAVGFLSPRSIVFGTVSGTFIGHLDGTEHRVHGVKRPIATSPASHLITGHQADADSTVADTVFDADGTPQLRVPGYELVSFIPSGVWLVGVVRERRELALISMTTRTITARLVLRKGTVVDHCWEDGTHVVLDVYDSNRSSVLRLGMDGRIERVPTEEHPVLPVNC